MRGLHAGSGARGTFLMQARHGWVELVGLVRLNTTSILAALTVLAAVTATLPTLNAEADPCAATRGAEAVGQRVCFEGATVANAWGPVADVGWAEAEGVLFINFEAAGQDLVILNTGGEWSPILPGAGDLHLRTNDVTTPSGPYRVLALPSPMIAAWNEALAERGVSVHAYLPVNHFLVSAPEDVGLSDLPFVLQELGLGPDAKLEPGLTTLDGERLLNVLSVPGAEGAFDAVVTAVEALGATEIQAHRNIERVTARMDPADARKLASNPHVMWIDQHGEAPETDMDKIRNFVGATHVETLSGFTGANVAGIVHDSGLYSHGDFTASFRGFCSNSSPSGHGTSVYGIVFGSGAGNSAGRGMIPDADGMFAQYFQATRYSAAACAKAQIDALFHTNSWGNSVPKDNTYDSFSNENDRVVLDLDVLMLQSMSNCGPQCARREAMAKNIISVGAVYHQNTEDLDDDNWQGTGFSSSKASTGPAADGRIKPELVGPYDSIFTTSGSSGYTSGFGGTSGATPVVAGSVGLTHEMARAGLFGGIAAGQTASPAAAKALLIATANAYEPEQVGSGNYGLVGLREDGDRMGRFVQGWGLPDLASMHDNGANALVDDETQSLQTGQSATYTYTVPPGTSALRVSLVWTDSPANPGASKTLVNDLDLRVSDATGAMVYRGNYGLDLAPSSIATPLGLGAAADRLNNNEQVFIDGPSPADYTITVSAAAVNVDAEPGTPAIDQPYALVVVPVS